MDLYIVKCLQRDSCLVQYIFKNVNIFYHKNNIFLLIFLFNTSPFLSDAHPEGT